MIKAKPAPAGPCGMAAHVLMSRATDQEMTMNATATRKCPVCLVDETMTDDLQFHIEGNHSPADVAEARLAALVDPALPVEDEGAPVYTVEYRGEDRNGKTLHRVEYVDELDAVRCIGSCGIYDNLTLVGYGPNIDRSKYRH